MLQYIAGRGGGPLVRLWQVRPPPSPALPLRTAFLRRFCRTHGRAPYSYFQPLILSRQTQTILVCATSVATHALTRGSAPAQRVAPPWTAPPACLLSQGASLARKRGIDLDSRSSVMHPREPDILLLSPRDPQGGPCEKETSSRETESEPVGSQIVARECVCVYYCRTYYKAVCGGGGGQ